MRLNFASALLVTCCGLCSTQAAHSAAQAVLTCPASIDNKSGTTGGTQFAGVQIISNPPNTSNLICVVSGAEQVFFEGRAGGVSGSQLANLQINFDIHNSPVPPDFVNPFADRLKGRHLAVHNGNLTRLDCSANPVGNQFPIDNYGADKLLTFAMRQGGEINRFWTHIPAPINNRLQPLTIYQAPNLRLTKNWFHPASTDITSIISTSSSCSGFSFNSVIDAQGGVSGGGNQISIPLYPGEEISFSEDVPEGYVSQLICDGELVEQKSTGIIKYDLIVSTDLEQINEQRCEINSHKIVDFNLRKVWFGLTDLSVDTFSLTKSIVFGESVPVNSPVIANLQNNIITGEPIVLGAPITIQETHSENWFDSSLECTSDINSEAYTGTTNNPFIVPNEVGSVLNCVLVTSRIPTSVTVTAREWNGPADDSSATITLLESNGGNQNFIYDIQSGHAGGVFLSNEPVAIGDYVTIDVITGPNWQSDLSRCLYPGPAGQPPIVIDETGTFRAINETGGKTIFCDVNMTRKSSLLSVEKFWNGIDDSSIATLQLRESAGESTTQVMDVRAGVSGFFIVDEPVFSGADITLSEATSHNWRSNEFTCTFGEANTPIAVDASGTFTVPADANGQNINCSVTNTLAPTRMVAENQFNAIDLGQIYNSGGNSSTHIFMLSTDGNGGADNELFTIDASTGVITFIAAPDFEMPGDADADNNYEVQVVVTDENGNMRTINIVIIVIDDNVNECSQALSNRILSQESDAPEWYLLSVPCDVPTNTTFGQLFKQLPADKDWSAYYYKADDSTPDYEQITANSVVPSPDVGFWFISIATVELALPNGSTPPDSSIAAPCTASAPCNAHEINPANRWNLLGNQSTVNVLYKDWKISNDSTPCSGNSPCSPTQASSNNIESRAYVYYPQVGDYRRLTSDETGQQVIMPWDGYWLLLHDTEGKTTSPWTVRMTSYSSQYIFVTDDSYSGAEIGGLANADISCQAAGTRAGLPGAYKAWLSDGISSPSVNFATIPETPYIRVDGALVANGYVELASPSGLIHQPVNMTPTFTDVGDADVWTSTNADGTALAANCDNWSNAGGGGFIGRASLTGTSWSYTNEQAQSCAAKNRLYCVGQ